MSDERPFKAGDVCTFIPILNNNTFNAWVRDGLLGEIGQPVEGGKIRRYSISDVVRVAIAVDLIQCTDMDSLTALFFMGRESRAEMVDGIIASVSEPTDWFVVEKKSLMEDGLSGGRDLEFTNDLSNILVPGKSSNHVHSLRIINASQTTRRMLKRTQRMLDDRNRLPA